MYSNVSNTINNQLGFQPQPQQQAGYFYQPQPAKAAMMKNPLTPEEVAELQKNRSTGFTMTVNQLDFTAAACTHKTKDHGMQTIDNPDGTVTCKICGATFRPVELSTAQVAEATQNLLDILQSIKYFYVDIPDSVAKEFFQIIPLLEKTPQLYDIAVNNFNSYVSGNNNGIQYANGQQNGFAMLNALGTGAMYQGFGSMQGQGYAPQGYVPPQYQQQQYGQQQQFVPAQGGQFVAPQNNPFGGYVDPSQGYAPQQQMAPQGFVPQGYAPQGYAPQGYAAPQQQGYVPQQASNVMPQGAQEQQQAQAQQQTQGATEQTKSFKI